jgi:hypothetical protein
LLPPLNPQKPTTGCSVVGTWSLVDGTDTAAIEFTAAGTFYGGPKGTDPSQTYTFDGQYSIVQTDTEGGPPVGDLEIGVSCGLGCAGSGSFTVQFQENCSFLTLNNDFDSCTGSRMFLTDTALLTRQ